MVGNCINYKTCPLINDSSFIIDPEKRNIYLNAYCEAGEERWSSCKRYIMKLKWHFCPDFVLPDTPKSTDEILDKYENEC